MFDRLATSHNIACQTLFVSEKQKMFFKFSINIAKPIPFGQQCFVTRLNSQTLLVKNLKFASQRFTTSQNIVWQAKIMHISCAIFDESKKCLRSNILRRGQTVQHFACKMNFEALIDNVWSFCKGLRNLKEAYAVKESHIYQFFGFKTFFRPSDWGINFLGAKWQIFAIFSDLIQQVPEWSEHQQQHGFNWM